MWSVALTLKVRGKRLKKKLRIAIIFGGKSSEHEVSIVSASSIFHALDKSKYDITLVGIDKSGRWLLPDQARVLTHSSNPRLVKLNEEHKTVSLVPFENPTQLINLGSPSSPDESTLPFDVVFPVLHGPYGEDGTIQGMLELAGVPYVGAGVLASAVGMDKAVQRVLFVAAGLPVVRHEVVREREWEEDREGVEARAEALGLPVFVKPAALGSSVGITKVKELDQLRAAVEDALSHGPKILIEKGVEAAREIECAVLGNDDPVASLPGEILPGHEFYDYEAKYLDEQGTVLQAPADLPDEVVQEVQRMAVAAFRAIDAEGMARVDFFYREEREGDPGGLIVNEINTIPGFTEVSMYPKLWEVSGLPYGRLIDRLVELALERHERNRKRGRTVSTGTPRPRFGAGRSTGGRRGR